MIPFIFAAQDKSTATANAATMVNGTTIFTITGGPISILELVSECVTANNATASTLQWLSTPTVGSAATFTAASASLANLTAGFTAAVIPTNLTTAPSISASNGGVLILSGSANRVLVKPGVITTVIGVGSTTGTWRHFMRWRPLHPDAQVVAAF